MMTTTTTHNFKPLPHQPTELQQQQQQRPLAPPRTTTINSFTTTTGLRTPSNRKTIYDRNLNRTRAAELSRASFAYLFSEMVSYAQKRVTGIQDLEKRYFFFAPPPLLSLLSPSPPHHLQSPPLTPTSNSPPYPLLPKQKPLSFFFSNTISSSKIPTDSTRKAILWGSDSYRSCCTASLRGAVAAAAAAVVVAGSGRRGSWRCCNSYTGRCGGTCSGGRRTRLSIRARRPPST